MENFIPRPSSGDDAGEGPDLKQLLGPLRRGWKIVLLVALLIGAATYVYYHREAPSYTATSSVLLEDSSLQSVRGVTPPVDPARTSENQAHLTMTPAVAQLAARRLDHKDDPLDLLALVEAIPDPDSDILTIEATAADPQRAADVANAFARALVQLGTARLRKEAEKASAAIEHRLERLAPTRENKGVRRSLQSQLKRSTVIETVPPGAARQVAPAVPPPTASGPRPARNAIFAGALGLILGALLVYGREGLRRRLPSSHAEEAYALPLLATVPFDRPAAAKAQHGPGLPATMIEPVRTLRTALNHGASAPPRTILITSAIQGEGKSIVTKSLALGFFQGGARTLVIDGDLRRPSLHGFFAVEREPGLSDILRSGGPLEQSVRPILLDGEIESARETPAGAVEANPAAAAGRNDRQPAPRSGEFDVLSAEEVEVLTRAAVSPEDKTRKTRRSPTKARCGHQGRGTANAGSRNGATRAGSSVDQLGVIDLLPGGRRASDPAALLGTAGMTRVLSEAANSYDVVLVDSSPLLTVSDAIPLARAVDGVIVVTRSDYTTIDAAESLRQALERLPDVTVIGLVANGVRDSEYPTQYRYRYAGGE
jgi:Mrp family chromosome partitioning ATPase/capsular polysaccharide biosynthesis protein